MMFGFSVSTIIADPAAMCVRCPSEGMASCACGFIVFTVRCLAFGYVIFFGVHRELL